MSEQNTSFIPNFNQSDTMLPTPAEIDIFGTYELVEPRLLPKPADVPESYIAYNPSSIRKVDAHDVMYVRIEPDRSDASSSHLGKAVVRPYIVDVKNPLAPLTPYYDADEMKGEDAALTRVKRKLQSGKILDIWLLSFVDPEPKPEKQNEVKSLRTRFYAGTSLKNMEHIADGPEWMKDIRVAQASGPNGTEIGVYGRPQPLPNSGNLTYTKLSSINELTAESIAAAALIDEKLFAIGSGVWGGVNDVLPIDDDRNILLAHRAWRTGDDGHGRHYEAVRLGHNTATNRIVELGLIATADKFPRGKVKDDIAADLSDVVFTGGGYNGSQKYVTFGVGDGNIGIGGLRRVRAS